MFTIKSAIEKKDKMMNMLKNQMLSKQHLKELLEYIYINYPDLPKNAVDIDSCTMDELVACFTLATRHMPWLNRWAEIYDEVVRLQSHDKHTYIAFIDIDGVLNNTHFIGDNPYETKYLKIHKEPMQQLKKLVNETGAKLILSSYWREYWGTGNNIGRELDRVFGAENLVISDRTGAEERSRSDEIKKYLNDHPEVEAFVVIDDDKCLFPNVETDETLAGKVVFTNEKYGFTESDMRTAIDIIKQQLQQNREEKQ